MNELKMGKWFKLPVDCSHIMDDTETPDSSDSIAIDGCVVLTDHHVEKVEIAINTYDKNQELIARQAEQIEMLRDALTEIAKLPEVRMDEGQYVACRALAQAFKGCEGEK